MWERCGLGSAYNDVAGGLPDSIGACVWIVRMGQAVPSLLAASQQAGNPNLLLFLVVQVAAT